MNSSGSAKILPTKVRVNKNEIRQLKEYNPDEELIKAQARLARLKMPEFKSLSDEEIVVLYVKEQTYESWRQTISSGLMLVSLGAAALPAGNNLIVAASTAAMNNADNISSFVVKKVPVDLTIKPDEIIEADQEVIVPEQRSSGLAGFLGDINVPSAIVADTEQLLVNGFSVPGTVNLIIKAVRSYNISQAEDTSKGADEFLKMCAQGDS